MGERPLGHLDFTWRGARKKYRGGENERRTGKDAKEKDGGGGFGGKKTRDWEKKRSWPLSVIGGGKTHRRGGRGEILIQEDEEEKNR